MPAEPRLPRSRGSPRLPGWRSRHRRRVAGNLADVVSRPEIRHAFSPSGSDLDIAATESAAPVSRNGVTEV
ncbi:MAG: hypothetical protein KBG85_10040, partial [Micropruina sp.]|nr:hypothetical protein [Micropruina sp.]